MMNVDLYTILGLSHDCTKNEIETKYKELVNIYHPDNVLARHNKIVKDIIKKYGDRTIPNNTLKELDARRIKKLEDATKTFNLINTAYEKLTRERELYDHEYKQYQDIIDSTEKLKESSRSFLEAQPTVPTEMAFIKKQKTWEEMNTRHGFNEDSMKSPAMNKTEFVQKIDDLRLLRIKQDRETQPEKIFDGQHFNNATFNALFEKMNKKSGKELELVSQPSAFNYTDNDSYCNYDNDNLYVNHDDNINFSAADFSNNVVKITPKDLENLDTSKYTTKENKITNKDIEQKQHEYDSFAGQMGTWSYKDFSKEITNKITPELERNEEFKTLEFVDRDAYQHFVKNTASKSTPLTRPETSSVSESEYTQQFQPILTNSQIPKTERSLEDIIKQRSMQDVQFNKNIK